MILYLQIVRAAGIEEGDRVVEIGPGPGGITRAILEAGCERLDVIEIDKRFIPPLQVSIFYTYLLFRMHNSLMNS